MKKFYTRSISLCILLLCTGAAMAQNSFWSSVSETAIPGTAVAERVIVPDNYVTSKLDIAAYRAAFTAAPMEFTPAASATPLLIELPMPNKTMAKFMVWESPVMAPALASQMPGIKTYTGQGLTDPSATVKIDFTYRGFHAMVLSSEGDYFIDPYFKNSFDYYISYFKKDFNPVNKPVSICEGVRRRNNPTAGTTGVRAPSGTQLRTYRFAVACTHEYAAYFGGTVSAALSAIVTTVNRVNGVYEKEVASRLVLVANNSSIVFANAGTDPFTGNDDADILIDESQTVIDGAIGAANYDIGHTFSTGAGGLANLGVVCYPGFKATGVTGSPDPVGDPYDIDYVAHEVGHQFGADHSFNGTALSCGGGNRNASTAYEVGSGSTIMAYAGICGSNNLQSNSDAYFHTISFDEIIDYITNSDGNTCPVTTATGNGFPAISTGTGGFTIPKNTPFTLTGSATDPNGDALTYCWEQFNLGSSGINTATSTSGPNFRSYSPTTSPTRTIPRISDVANNTTSFREVLYNGSTNRTFNFRLTARDNKSGGGGVNYNTLSFVVSGSAGPLSVSAPNTAVVWAGNSTQTVTWNVNSTDIAPVSCSNVRITLSTDGGLTYPTTVLASTPNDGTESIIVPNIASTTARIRVECVFSNYSFFDISNTNFTITFTIPVSLLDFTAQPDKSRVIAQWQTSQEINSSKFIIERATDGSNFVAIGTVNAAGNSSLTRTYQFTDIDPRSGMNYYRLKLVDRDGSYKYSKIVTAKFSPAFDLQISPNPAHSMVNISGKALAGTTLLEIFASSGQRVMSKTYTNAAQFREDVNVKGYAAGLYRVRISNGENVVNKKLVIMQ